jgi:hypothetical protein
MSRRDLRRDQGAPRQPAARRSGEGDHMIVGRIIALVTAAAFVALVAASLTGGQPKPKHCNDFLQENLFSCDMAKGSPR